MKMNSIGLLICLSTVAGLWSCNKSDDQVAGFDLVYQRQLVIPAGISQFDVHHFFIKNIPTNYLNALQMAGKTDADVKTIITAKSNLVGVFGDANLNYIDQVSLRIYNEGDPDDYIEIAYRQPVPLEPGNELPLLPSLANYKRFMTDNRFSLELVLWLRKPTTIETELRLDLSMKATY
jgi:hypothetical protein